MPATYIARSDVLKDVVKSLLQLQVPKEEIVETFHETIIERVLELIEENIDWVNAGKIPTVFESIGIYNNNKWIALLKSDYEGTIRKQVVEALQIAEFVDAIERKDENVPNKIFKVAAPTGFGIHAEPFGRLFTRYLMQKNLDEAMYVPYPLDTLYFDKPPTEKDILNLLKYVLRYCLVDCPLGEEIIPLPLMPYLRTYEVDNFFLDFHNVRAVFDYIGELVATGKVRAKRLVSYSAKLLSFSVRSNATEYVLEKIMSFRHNFNDEQSAKYVEYVLSQLEEDISIVHSELLNVSLELYIKIAEECINEGKGRLEQISKLLHSRFRSQFFFQDFAKLSKKDIERLHEVITLVAAFESM